jgi:hypothetical protein
MGMTRRICAVLGVAMLAACNVSIGNNQAANDQGVAAPANTHFVNSRDNARSAALREHYADFSFDYPTRWSVSPQPTDGTAQNYVRVAAPMIMGYEPYAVMVGFAYGTGDAARDRASIEAGTLDLAGRFGRSFEEYRIVSAGPATVGPYDSHGWRFTASAPGLREGEPRVQVYGRGDIVLPPDATKGITLVTLATSRADDVRGPAEVGETGVLKAVLDSFRLGGAQGADGK